MWYDRFSGIPPRHSPLETIFTLIMLERQRSRLLETRAMVQSIVGMHESKKTQDPAIAAFQEYCDNMFPFIDKAKNGAKDEIHQILAKFVSQRAKINLTPIYKAKAEHAKQMVSAQQFKLRPKPPGTI